MPIIIGDVHGCYNTLMELVKQLPDDKIILTGDLIDRGPRSKEVVQWVIDNKDRVSCVLGNHEDYYLKGLKNWEDMRWWQRRLGGYKTLVSYSMPDQLAEGKMAEDILTEHVEFIKSLPLYIEDGDLLVSHSAVQSTLKTAVDMRYVDDGILWYRGAPAKLEGKFHVFGHTPVGEPEITDYFANIDTGCCYKNEIGDTLGLGKLTALQYPSMKTFSQDNIDA